MESGDPSKFDSVKSILLGRNYRNIRPLGTGSYGDVFSAITPSKDRIAIKLIKNENSWPFEEQIWPKLKHPNVLGLLEVINVADLNLKLYIMPRHRYVLERMVSRSSFLSDCNGLRRVKSWISDVLHGIEYMHETGYAHLDLKTDNILISCEDSAIIFYFSGITPINVPVKRLCAPLEYCPPEWYDPDKKTEATACDIWLYGLMAIQVLTGHWPCRNMSSVSDACSWKKNIQPVLVQALQRGKFFDITKEAFPAVDLSMNELFDAHDFVSFIMKWDPRKRPSLQQIMQHPFLQSVRGSVLISDKQPKSDEVKKIVKDPLIECWMNPIKNNEQIHANEKNVANATKTKSSNRKSRTTKTMVNDCSGQVKNNPFICSSNYQEFINYMKIEEMKGKTLIKSPFINGWIIVAPETNLESNMAEENVNHQTTSEFQIEERNCNLQHHYLDDMPSNDLKSKKLNLGGKIKQWINNKFKKTFQRKKNFVKLSEDSE